MSLVAGTIGVVCILAAFLLDEFSTINTKTVPYNLLNILGSGLLMYYAYTLESWPFLILNGVWLIAAVVKLVKISRN